MDRLLIQRIFTILYCEALLAAVLYGCLACARDARLRGHSRIYVCLLGVFLFPLGTIAWLAFRPAPVDPATPRGRRRFDLDDFRTQ